jgi:hypothetical protein
MKCNPITVFKVHISSQDFEWRWFYLDDRSGRRGSLQISPGFADFGGGQEEVTGGQRADNAVVPDRCQSHGGDAATLFAVGGAAKLAGCDLG